MYGYRMFENGARQPVRQLRRRGPGALPDRRAAPEGGRVDRGRPRPSTPLFLSLMFVAPHGEVGRPRARRPSRTSAPRRATSAATAACAMPRAIARRARRAATSRPTCASLHRASTATRRAHPRRLPLAPRVADRRRRGGRGRRRRARAHRAARLDLHPLHLRQRLLPGRAPTSSRASTSPTTPSSHVPLLIRGPGIPRRHGVGRARHQRRPRADDPRGRRRDRRPADGRALAAARSRATRACARAGRSCTRGSWRATSTATARAQRHRVGEYHAIRTARYLYVEWHRRRARALRPRARSRRDCTRATATAATAAIRRSLHRELVRLRDLRRRRRAASRSARCADERNPRPRDLLETPPMPRLVLRAVLATLLAATAVPATASAQYQPQCPGRSAPTRRRARSPPARGRRSRCAARRPKPARDASA